MLGDLQPQKGLTLERKSRAVFFGTPRFSVPAFRALCAVADVSLAVSRPDRGTGRDRKVSLTPVKVAAQELSIPVLQPEKLKNEEFITALKEANADFFFTAAYGKIIPETILNLPPRGCLNLHASLLPKYRGSAPIQWAVVNGENVTGFTLMLMDRGMDTGPMLEKVEIPIRPGETGGELTERMSRLAPEFVRKSLPRYLRGDLQPAAQNEDEASYAPMIKKEDGLIDWSRPAGKIISHILGMNPWPMAHSLVGGKRLRIIRAEEVKALPGQLSDAPAGTTHCDENSLIVRCGPGAVRILEIQAEGKKAMEASCYLHGSAVPEKLA